MNWLTKRLALVRKSFQRGIGLYKYQHDLAVILGRTPPTGKTAPAPDDLLLIRQLQKDLAAVTADLDRANFRLRDLEHDRGVENSSGIAIKWTIFKSLEYCFVASVPGSFAEFGTFNGTTASYIARAIRTYQQQYQPMEAAHQILNRTFYLFDSFAGLPPMTEAADVASPHVAANVWIPGAMKGASAAQLATLVGAQLDARQFQIIPGFFKATVPTIDPAVSFAFLHVDCDLFESTMDALGVLFARKQVSPGCMILFDDWNCNRASNDHGERKAWQHLAQRYSIQYSDLGSYACVGHRFIVHSYSN